MHQYNFLFKKYLLSMFSCFMLISMGLATQASAEEIYGMLRWRKGGDKPIAVGDLGFYLRNVGGQLGFGEYAYAKSVGEVLGIEDDPGLLPDEIIVVITNNSDAPLDGGEVDIFATNIYAANHQYIIDHYNQSDLFAMRLVENPNEATWHRKGWRIFGGVQPDGRLSLYTHDGAYRMIFHKNLMETNRQRWAEVGFKTENVLESYFTPLPLPHRVVPQLILNTGSQAMASLAAQGLAPKLIPGYTHDPELVGYVLQQFPEAWIATQMGAEVQIVIPQDVTHALLPNVQGIIWNESYEQLMAAGLQFSPHVAGMLTDDSSLWGTVESVLVQNRNGDLVSLSEAAIPQWLQDVTADHVDLDGIAYTEKGKIYVNKSAPVYPRLYTSGESVEGHKEDGHTGIVHDVSLADGSQTINIFDHMGTPTPTINSASFFAAIMAPNGTHYVTANGDQATLSANVTHAKGWERFEIFSPDGSVITSGSRVIIRTVHGKYWTPFPDGSLQAHVEHIGHWEPFVMEKLGGTLGEPFSFGDQFTLLGVHGTYVSASEAGGGGISANGPGIGGWEKFMLVDHPK